MRTAPLLAALWILCCSTGCGPSASDAPADMAAPFQSNCTVPAPGAEALRPAGQVPGQSTWIQPGGRALTPVGKVLPIGGFPLALRALPAPLSRHVVVSTGGKGDNALLLVDTQQSGAAAIVDRADYPRGNNTPQSKALFYGLALGTQAGLRVFASGGGYDLSPAGDPAGPTHVVDVYTITGTGAAGDPARLTRDRQIRLKSPLSSGRYPAGLALSPDERRLYVAGQADGSLSIVNVDRTDAAFGALLGSIEGLGLYPYDVALDDTQKRAYVSLWGGEVLGNAPLRVRDGLVALDVSDPRAPRRLADAGLDAALATGKASEGLLRFGRRLFVAAADADRVSALDLDALAAPQVVQVGEPLQGLLGASPGGLAVDPARGRVYVTTAYDNALVVLNSTDLSPLGRLPTAAYPTAVAVLDDGTVVVTAGKGVGTYPTDQEPRDGNTYSGVMQVIDRPSDQDLALGEQQVRRNNHRPQGYAQVPACAGAERRFPLPPQPGDPTPIRHVFLIIKENKTYDAILGDQPGTRGRPDLLLFPPKTTPNQHALATEFANLDNYYANSEASIQGHAWTTAAFSNDFVEKAWLTTWGRGSRSEGIFAGRASSDYVVDGAAGSIFQVLDRAGVSYHNYGEAVNAASAAVKLDPGYPGLVFNLDVPDVDRARYILDRLADPAENIEQLHYILFPRNHTYGTRPGKPTPEYMIADNDEAVGLFIEGLSRSRYWKDSVVFVTEDDPQDGADHVDHRRSVCLVIGPWVKRGFVSSVNYDFPSLFRTIELLLGVPPTNQLLAGAAPMYDVFTGQPDFAPYTLRPRQIDKQVNALDAPLAEESLRIDFSQPDTAPLGRILWRAVRGQEPPFGARPLGDDDD